MNIADSKTSSFAPSRAEGFARPYVVSWNLTYRCNLAGETAIWTQAQAAGRHGELRRSERARHRGVFKVIDDIATFAPESLTILTGGRRSYGATSSRSSAAPRIADSGSSSAPTACAHWRTWRSAWQRPARGTLPFPRRLNPDRHDRFRKIRGAWPGTRSRARTPSTGPGSPPSCRRPRLGQSRRARRDRRLRARSPRRQGLEPLLLVPTGRGQLVSDMTPRRTTKCSPRSTKSSRIRPARCS